MNHTGIVPAPDDSGRSSVPSIVVAPPGDVAVSSPSSSSSSTRFKPLGAAAARGARGMLALAVPDVDL